MALSDWTDFPWLFKLPPITSRVAYALTAVAPVMCLVTGQTAANILWSSFAIFIVLVDDSVRRMMSKGKEDLDNLELSKYTARGA